MNRFTRSFTSELSLLEITYVIFYSPYITTTILLYPFDQYNPVTKSTDILFHLRCEIGRGHKTLSSLCLGVSGLLELEHFQRNQFISVRIPCQKHSLRYTFMVFNLPNCGVVVLL